MQATHIAVASVLALAFALFATRPDADAASMETSKLAAAEMVAVHAGLLARPKQGPWIHAEEPVFDWGEISEGEEIQHTFKLENRGNETVFIEKARTSCGCGAFDFSREIPPGGEGHLSILIPGNKTSPGKLRASITLRTNARGDDVLVMTGRVLGRVVSVR